MPSVGSVVSCPVERIRFRIATLPIGYADGHAVVHAWQEEGVVPNVVEIERFSSGAGHGGTLPRLNFFHEENRNE